MSNVPSEPCDRSLGFAMGVQVFYGHESATVVMFAISLEPRSATAELMPISVSNA